MHHHDAVGLEDLLHVFSDDGRQDVGAGQLARREVGVEPLG
jgi:hypothetical protein